MLDEAMGLTPDAYAQAVSMDFDLDLWPSDMVLTCDTLSGSNDHFRQIILKSHQISNGIMCRKRFWNA